MRSAVFGWVASLIGLGMVLPVAEAAPKGSLDARDSRIDEELRGTAGDDQAFLPPTGEERLGNIAAIAAQAGAGAAAGFDGVVLDPQLDTGAATVLAGAGAPSGSLAGPDGGTGPTGGDVGPGPGPGPGGPFIVGPITPAGPVITVPFHGGDSDHQAIRGGSSPVKLKNSSE